jgi:hypothetical protein
VDGKNDEAPPFYEARSRKATVRRSPVFLADLILPGQSQLPRSIGLSSPLPNRWGLKYVTRFLIDVNKPYGTIRSP